MDMNQLLRALGLQQAYQAYQQNIGEPFAAVVGGAGRGYLGLDKPEYGGLLSEEAYKTGQAMGNMPAVGAPAGAFKAAAKAPGLLSDAAQFLRNLSPEQMGLLGMAASKGFQNANPTQTVRIYHGGNTGLEEIKGGLGPGNIFGGIFGSTERKVAASHGDGSVYSMDVPKEAILSQQMLDSMGEKELTDVLKKAMPWIKKEDIDEAFMAVIQDKANKVDDDNLMRIFREDSPGEAGWEAQRIRGEVARLLGKSAVEMADEHGVSYLVLPGIKPILDLQ